MNSNINDSGASYLRDLLSSNIRSWRGSHISVPVYQRPYSWDAYKGKKHVKKLFDDLIQHYEKEIDTAYYLGGLVFVSDLVQNTNKITVLDGQQRLATLYLFAAAIIYNLENFNTEVQVSPNIDDYEKRRYAEDILGTERQEGKIQQLKKIILTDVGNNEPRLQMYYKDDKRHFDHCVTKYNSRNLPNGLRKNHPIINSFNLLCSEITKYLEENSKGQTTAPSIYSERFALLNSISDYVVGESAEVTYTTIDDGNEFTIFETLNDRGKQLNIYDLTRIVMINIETNHGYEFNTANVFDQEIKKNINPIGNFKEKNAYKLIIDNWNMQNSSKITISKYMQAFDDFYKLHPDKGGFKKKSARGKENFEEFLNLLKTSSYALSELIEPSLVQDSNIEGSPGNLLKLKKKITTFNITNVSQYYSLYFALRNKEHDCDIISKYLDLVEKAYINILFLPEGSPAKLENLFSGFAYDIFTAEHEINDLYNEHYNKIKQLVDASDFDFIDKFSMATASNNQSNYILRRITNKLQQNTIPMENVTLEHILPKKWEANWSDITFKDNIVLKNLDPDISDQYLSRIGNHTLLLNSVNIPLNNSSYENKLQSYQNENINITKGDSEISVTNYSNWNANSIEKRQKALAKIAKEIWGM